MHVDQGDKVSKGQLLFQLETQSLTQDAEAAKARVSLAQVEVNRLIPLVEKDIVSAIQLESAKANLQDAKSNLQSIRANTELDLVNNQQALLQSSIDLYRALGGGWR